MGLISTTALAAHQIALQVAAILFMVPFGIGMAATVRVGHAVGRNDAGAVRRAGYRRDLLGIVLVAVADARRDRRPLRHRASCSSARAPTRPPNSAATLLLVGATFFIADAHPDHRRRRAARHERHADAAVVRDHRLLADRLRLRLLARLSGRRLGAVGVWIGLSIGTAVYAVLLLLRFRALASKLAFAA